MIGGNLKFAQLNSVFLELVLSAIFRWGKSHFRSKNKVMGRNCNLLNTGHTTFYYPSMNCLKRRNHCCCYIDQHEKRVKQYRAPHIANKTRPAGIASRRLVSCFVIKVETSLRKRSYRSGDIRKYL